LNKFLEDKFKGKKAKAESILQKFKNDTRISSELKSKIKERMNEKSDSDSNSDDSDLEDNKTPRNNINTGVKKAISSEKQRIHDRLIELRAKRSKKLKGLPKDQKDKEMKDESNEDLKEKEKMKKLEILKVKESKLKRNLSMQLKRRGKNDETDKKIETKRPMHI